MGGINTNKVLIAGVAAGVAMTVVDVLTSMLLLEPTWNAALERLGLPGMDSVGAGQIAAYVATYIVVGWLMAFVYAGMLTRLGAGTRTAMIVALVFWLFGGQMMAGLSLLGIFEWSLFALGAVAMLIVMAVGGYVVARLYREA